MKYLGIQVRLRKARSVPGEIKEWCRIENGGKGGINYCVLFSGEKDFQRLTWTGKTLGANTAVARASASIKPTTTAAVAHRGKKFGFKKLFKKKLKLFLGEQVLEAGRSLKDISSLRHHLSLPPSPHSLPWWTS